MSFRTTSVNVFQFDTKEALLAKALEFRDLSGFECERMMKNIRLVFHKRKLHEDVKLPYDWAVARVLSDGSVRRVNGQHTTEMFLRLTPEEWEVVTFPVWVIETHYDCDTHYDRAHLFNQFDPPQSARGLEDNIGVHTALHDDIKHVSRYAANKSTQGMIWYFQHIEGLGKADARTQFELLHRNGEIHRFLLFCDQILNQSKTTELVSKPVVGAMFHLTRDGEPETFDFWKKVATASILDPESYHAKLADFLDNARKPHFVWPKAQRDKFANKRKPNDREVFQACLRIFHAEQLGTPRIDPVDRLRDRSMAEVVERYQVTPAA